MFSTFVNRNTHWWCQTGNTAAGFLTPVPVSTPKMLKPKIVLLIKKLKALLRYSAIMFPKRHTPFKHVLLTNSNWVVKYKIILPPFNTKHRDK